MGKINPYAHDKALTLLKSTLSFRASVYKNVGVEFPDDMHFTFRVTEQNVHIFVVRGDDAVILSDAILDYPSNKLIASLALLMEGSSLSETIKPAIRGPT